MEPHSPRRNPNSEASHKHNPYASGTATPHIAGYDDHTVQRTYPFTRSETVQRLGPRRTANRERDEHSL